MNSQITGTDAIEIAEKIGIPCVWKHADPLEEARENLPIDEAREVALEDEGLVYLPWTSEPEDVEAVVAAAKMRLRAVRGGYALDAMIADGNARDLEERLSWADRNTARALVCHALGTEPRSIVGADGRERLEVRVDS